MKLIFASIAIAMLAGCAAIQDVTKIDMHSEPLYSFVVLPAAMPALLVMALCGAEMP